LPELLPVNVVEAAESLTNTFPVVPAFAVNVVAFVLIPFPLVPMPPDPALRLSVAVVIWLPAFPLVIEPLPAPVNVTDVAPFTVSAATPVPNTMAPLPVVIFRLY
jgi:hypothetical protein